MRDRAPSQVRPPARAFASALVFVLLAGSITSLADSKAILTFAGMGSGSNPIVSGYPLAFDSEHIRLEIIGDSLEVRASYVLRCRTPGEALPPVIFPCPRDSLMGGFRMLSASVRGVRDSSSVPIRWEIVPGVNGARLWLPSCLADTIVTDAVCRQKLFDNYARYIVTTTRAWGHPLAHASFEIQLPPGAVPIDFSFPFEPADSQGLFQYEAYDFMPDHDVIVRWRE